MPNSYTVGLWIDRSGPSRIEVNYLIDPYKDPKTGENHVYTTWDFKLAATNGGLIGSNKGAGAGFGSGYLDYTLDTGVGIKIYKVSFKAYNDVSRKGFDLKWMLFDGALEKADLSIAGTAGIDLVFGGFGADYIRSSGGDDVIDAGGGDDVVNAGAGADELDGGEGDDILIGGAGDDRYIVDSLGEVIVERAGEGLDKVESTVSHTLADHVENLSLRGSSSINGTGNAQANLIDGNFAANVLDGRAGADVMIGDGGSDTFYVDDAGDQTVEVRVRGSDADTDTVVTSVGYALGVWDEIEVLRTIDAASKAALDLTGNQYRQTILGNSGANRIDGGGGADTMIGGAGNDTYAVDYIGDRVVEATGGGRDIVATGVSYTLEAGQAIEELRVLASAGNRPVDLTGNAFAQTVVGNNGANVLNGGLGQDVLTGRGGADTFVFDTALGAGNVDRITDFSAPADTIRLENAIFTALAAGELAADRFKDLGVAGAKLDATDRIVYDRTTGVLSYDADGCGTKAAMVQFALVDTKAVLTAADFFVV